MLRRSKYVTMAHGEVNMLQFGIYIIQADMKIALHSSRASLAAQNFNMPALSPTMTEGNIATWKIKEGTTDHTHHRSAGEPRG